MFPVLKVEFNLLKLFPAFIPIIACLWDNKGYCFYRKVLSKMGNHSIPFVFVCWLTL